MVKPKRDDTVTACSMVGLPEREFDPLVSHNELQCLVMLCEKGLSQLWSRLDKFVRELDQRLR